MHTRQIHDTFERGQGILRLMPAFVPFHFNQAGGRLRLHPDDLYPYGMQYGSVKERWFSSVVRAFRGDSEHPETGLSFVQAGEGAGDRFLFKDAVEELGAQLIGQALMDTYGTWPMHAKFFDYKLPLFHHLHLDETAAGRIGRLGKPEAYYYPHQMNNYPGEFPLTYFGFSPEVTREQVRQRLLDWERRDTRLTELSRAYRIELGTGWYTPPGVLHAPGSYLTYEPQWNSTVGAVFENVASGEIFPYSSLSGGCPEEKKSDIEYILSLLDWEKNVDPEYRKHYFRPPLPRPVEEESYTETWVTYGNEYFSAIELSLAPGRQAVVKDPAAYGCILIQGHGLFGPYEAEAARMLRWGQASGDEFFVSAGAAQMGVFIQNRSRWEPLVLLKHFGPDRVYFPK